MRKSIYILFLFACLSGIWSLNSCKKLTILSKNHLDFSTDTLVFDTVFTTIGSTTNNFKIYNNDNRTLRIDEVELMGGSSSFFRINFDGVSGTNFSGIEIERGDSLFVFVEVTLETNGQLLPMVVEDSIRFRTNGVDQYVNLAVWGQDAYFHYNDLNEGVWPNDKPHVIYGYAAVDSSKSLTILAGTKVHLHKNSLLYVYKSTLNVNGQLGNEVEFLGDRLESYYDDVSGQYYGIYFHEAHPSTIDYAIIRNGTAGIHLYSRHINNSSYTLTLTNSIVKNNASYGLFVYSGAKVKAENTIVSKNGVHSVLMLEGGDLNFNHCNILGYGGSSNAAIGISNYYNHPIDNTTNVGSINECKIYNSVITGGLQSEIAIDTLSDPAINLSFDFKNCLIKSETVFQDPFYQSIIWNEDPLFEDIQEDDFTFSLSSNPLSSLNNNGIASSVMFDINGNPRANPPDIGVHEIN